jgi:C4-dicarboxylate-specific signal transduction histidine kinase
MAMDLHIDTLELGLAGAPDHAADYQSVVKLAELSHRIATIVRGFKLLSHTDAQDAMSETTVKQLLEPALDLCKGRIKPLGIALSVELPELDEPMMCRIVAISQVVLNLLNNSIDAVTEQPPGQRWIAIRASAAAADRIRIELTDSGRIASEEVRTRMFESFFTTKPLGKGTGLGLSIAKLTVAQHGGTLMFDAASVHTRFVIELPRFAS